MDEYTALAHVEDDHDGMTMVVSPREAKARLQQLQAFVHDVMIPDTDYGKIPGIEKPSLFKPGAEKLAEIYGLAPEYTFEQRTEDWDNLFFYYLLRCRLTRHGVHVAEGLGSCNSREEKYAWRWVWENEVPAGIDKASLMSKTGTSKAGKPWTRYRLPNEDVASIVNTILKMATKRAYVAAVISATRSSNMFTQDVEDMPRIVDVDPTDQETSIENSEPQTAKHRAAPKAQGASGSVWPWAAKKDGDPEQGTPIATVKSSQLEYLAKYLEKKIGEDPNGKYADTNAMLLRSVREELAERAADAKDPIREPGQEG